MSFNNHDISLKQRNDKLKQVTLEEFLARTRNTTTPSSNSQRNRQRLKNSSVGRASSPSSSTPLCKGISLTSGLPCKRPVVSDNFCFQHRGQVHADNIFGIPTTPRHNSGFLELCDPEDIIESDNENVEVIYPNEKSEDENDDNFTTKLTPAVIAGDGMGELVSRLNGLSIANVEKDCYNDSIKSAVHNKDEMLLSTNDNHQQQSQVEPNEKSTVITIRMEKNLENLEVKITQSPVMVSPTPIALEKPKTSPTLLPPAFPKAPPPTPSEAAYQRSRTPPSPSTRPLSLAPRAPPPTPAVIMDHSETLFNPISSQMASIPSTPSRTFLQEKDLLIEPSGDSARKLTQGEGSKVLQQVPLPNLRSDNPLLTDNDSFVGNSFTDSLLDNCLPEFSSLSLFPEIEEDCETQRRSRLLSSMDQPKSILSRKESFGFRSNKINVINKNTPTHSSARIQIDLTNHFTSPSSRVESSPLKVPPGSIRCKGRNRKTGKQCTRTLRITDENGDDSGEWYCFQHKIEYDQQKTPIIDIPVFVPGQSKLAWIRFDDWIDQSLRLETKRLLETEMKKPISDGDEAGFIYVYKLVEEPLPCRDPDHIFVKVGRATNVTRRLYQWSQQCGYKLEVIEYFPNVKNPTSLFHKESQLYGVDSEDQYRAELISAFNNGPKCKYTHRAERLIHIELGDKYRADLKECPGCGNIHREWFKVPASNEKGWDEVRRMIVHWITYVEKTYGVG